MLTAFGIIANVICFAALIAALISVIWYVVYLLRANRKLTCPACGSSNITTTYEDTPLVIPLAPPASFHERIDVCQACNCIGDFTMENDDKIEAALGQAEYELVRAIIESLEKDGISASYVERALGLAPHMLERWKAGAFLGSDLTLLRFVRMYPWLLHVAESYRSV